MDTIDKKDTDKKQDFLDVDSRIEGQQWVCLSFLSPEKIIQNKEAFNVAKFIQSICKEEKWTFKEVYSKYEDFIYKYSSELQRDFDEENKFQTSMRGLKVRGTYSTKEEAESRAKKLSTIDSSHNVFIGEVGHWLPWDPCADKVQSEVFQNSQLNDMMEKYQENEINKDIFYEEQKRDKIKAAREEIIRAKQAEAASKLNKEETSNALSDVVEKVADDVEKVVDDVEKVVEEVQEKVVEEVATINNDIKQSLEGIDPWLKNKLKLQDNVAEVTKYNIIEPVLEDDDEGSSDNKTD